MGTLGLVLLMLFAPIIVIVVVLAFYMLMGGAFFGALELWDRITGGGTRTVDGEENMTDLHLEPIRATKDFNIDEHGTPDRLGGTLYILLKFEDVGGRFGDKHYLPVNWLPAHPEVVERTITDFLEKVRDPEFQQTIISRCPDHRHILRSDYIHLLRVCLGNVSRFIDEDEATYLNLVLGPVRTDGQSTTREEIQAHFESVKQKLGLTSDDIHRAIERNTQLHRKGFEIERRLQSKGL